MLCFVCCSWETYIAATYRLKGVKLTSVVFRVLQLGDLHSSYISAERCIANKCCVSCVAVGRPTEQLRVGQEGSGGLCQPHRLPGTSQTAPAALLASLNSNVIFGLPCKQNIPVSLLSDIRSSGPTCVLLRHEKNPD